MKSLPRLKGIILFVSLAAFAFPLWGDLYYTDDPEILNLIHLSRRMGKVIPFSSFPVHGSDILDFANFLLSGKAAGNLNETDRFLLEDLIDGLEKQREGGILIKGGLAAAYEHRFSTGVVTIEDEDLPNAEDVRRAYTNFSPFLSLYAGGGTFNGVWLAAQIDIRPSWEDDFSPMNNFLTKVNISYDFVKKGILAWNGAYMNLSVSRDTVHWGNPQGSTLYPSALLPHMDSVSMNVPLGPFTFDYMLASIMPKRAHPKYRDIDDAIDRHYPDAIGRDNSLGDHFGFMKDPDSSNPSAVLMAAHRFQWNFGRVKAGVGGTIVYARPNNQFLVTDFLPVLVYHNSDSVPNNLSMVLDAQWAIVSGLSLSVMFGFDDIGGGAIGIPDGEIPTIPGAVLQLEYSTAGSKLFQFYMLEAGYTHYLWGNFGYEENDEKLRDMYGVYLARAIYRYTPNKNALLLPLTSPYGPGSLWGKLKADLFFRSLNIRAGAELLFLAKNSEVNLVDTFYGAKDSLNSFDRFFFVLDIPVSYIINYKPGSLEFSVWPTVFFGSEGTAFECTLGVRWSMKGSGFFSPRYR